MINNLNLIVTSPDGKRYCGNVFDAPYGDTLDTANNVESTYLPNPVVGKYRIDVIGSNITEQT